MVPCRARGFRYDFLVMEPDELMGRVRAFVRERAHSLARGRAVLAVSGGGDSIAMASLLIEAAIVRADGSVVAWFDHRLRGEEDAACERAAVATLCSRYEIEMIADAWETPRRSEAAAREARYGFLAGVARERGIDAIATAHTSDDQVETVVMRSMRGAGAWGMRGILVEGAVVGGGEDGRWKMEDGSARVVDHRGDAIVVVRPVLGCTRGELRAWCAARRLAYVDDASNEDVAYLRNRVRHDVLPRMEAEEAGVRARMLAVADAASARVEALAREAAVVVRAAHAEIGVAHVVLDRALLREMVDDVAAHAYRLAVMSVLGDAREFDRRHYATMTGAARGATGAAYEMPRGVVVTVDAAEVIVSRGALALPGIDPNEEHAAPWAGVMGAWWVEVWVGDGGWRMEDGRGDGQERRGSSVGGCSGGAVGDGSATSASSETSGAVVRGRRAGDWVRLRGGGRKKLSDVYVDAKVPRRERDAAPVIAVGAEVVWSAVVDVVSQGAGGGGCVVRAWRV